MGAVYLVRSPTLPRWEALKLLRTDLGHDTHVRSRFLQEADITAGLEHPNIVRVFNRGETDTGQLWMTMEYIAGTDAESALQHGQMTAPKALHIITEVARALDYAHSRGVVHQDVKPSNFLLGQQEPGGHERVVLSDFGAALTPQTAHDAADGPMTATLAYAAPEVITGEPLDGRADVYSLGCTLFRLLSGEHPYTVAAGVPETVRAHLDTAPPRLSDRLSWISPQLDTVIVKALAKSPAERYRSAGEFAAAAAEAATPTGNTATPTGNIPAAAATPGPDTSRGGEPPAAIDADEPTNQGGEAEFLKLLPYTRTVASKRRKLIIGSGVAAALIAIAALWMVGRTPSSPPTTPPSTTAAVPEALSRLMRLLPAGYPTGSCVPEPPPGTPTVTCGQNSDSGGPAAATYTLAGTPDELRAALAQLIQETSVVICPGNIQSPGPWRRNSSPTVVRGTVMCGLRDGVPRVVWTNDGEGLLADVQARSARDPSLDQLYAWWGSHS
jgi:serine/threonine-protein kinase